jgi:cyclopropane fatty-acyl-phospholipid synthase-like methyltransferase
MTPPSDRVSHAFWDKQWATESIPRPVDPTDESVRNTVRRAFHAYFSQYLDRMRKKPDVALLEVGCARSIWLPYFAHEFGFHVTGIDYSETGCAKSREILVAQHVSGTVVLQDMFLPSPDLIGRFDIVVSFGLIEHFEDSAKAVRALAAFLKPGGVMITNIPNVRGTIGFIQRLFNRPVYDQHVPHTDASLAAAHKAAGLRVQECQYFLSTGYNILNFQRPDRNNSVNPVARVIKIFLMSLSVAIWFVERHIGRLPVSRSFSPYVNCVAIKPDTRT